MAARKRESGETHKEYRKNLKKEAGALEQKLLGRMLWPGYMGTYRRYITPVGVYKFVAHG